MEVALKMMRTITTLMRFSSNIETLDSEAFWNYLYNVTDGADITADITY